MLYLVLDGIGLKKRIRVNPHWRRLLVNNYSVIKSWVQYNKAQFLQDRNPGVPGIIYKINPENEDVRKLDQVRDLWKTISEMTGKPIMDIYTGKEVSPEALSLDHFVPRSYISNDELWNLIPMNRNLNSSKSNKLPMWDAFFVDFAKYQFYLYDLVFAEGKTRQSELLIEQFNRCRRNNLNAIWAIEELYKPCNSMTQFMNILEMHLKPIHESARMQGYEIWKAPMEQ